jgi:hypothetical protein
MLTPRATGGLLRAVREGGANKEAPRCYPSALPRLLIDKTKPMVSLIGTAGF